MILNLFVLLGMGNLMKHFCKTVALVAVITLAGCSTSQSVTVAKHGAIPAIETVAVAQHGGTSRDMDTNLQQAALAQGLKLTAPVSENTTKSETADALLSYSDSWRWDIVMYLRKVTLNLTDGKTGDLLVTGTWENSTMHGFQSASQIVSDLFAEMMSKLKQETKPAK